MHMGNKDSSDSTSLEGRFTELVLRCLAAVKHI